LFIGRLKFFCPHIQRFWNRENFCNITDCLMHDPQSIEEIIIYCQCILPKYILIITIGNLLLQVLVLSMLPTSDKHRNCC